MEPKTDPQNLRSESKKTLTLSSATGMVVSGSRHSFTIHDEQLMLLQMHEVRPADPSQDFRRAARAILSLRRARRTFLSAVAMAEPAWDLLLALYGTQEDEENIAVGKLTSMAGLSLTTALRWIVRLEGDGLVAREADPSDARVVKIHLTVRGERAMRDSFAAARRDS